jgi:hypothetical protein
LTETVKPFDYAFWRRHPDLNRSISVLQTDALPLGYAAKKMERETGFEPATSTLARSHSTTELFPLNERTLLTGYFRFVNKKIIF